MPYTRKFDSYDGGLHCSEWKQPTAIYRLIKNDYCVYKTCMVSEWILNTFYYICPRHYIGVDKPVVALPLMLNVR